MTTGYSIDLAPATDYERASYGIVLVSVTEHDFTGGGIHNRYHPHVLQVWDNSRRPNTEAQGGVGCYLDPQNLPTDERYSFLWSPRATVISAHRGVNAPRGATLKLQDTAVLNIHGYVIGEIQMRARSLHNPHGVLVDTASSVSRQHYIETGEYLAAQEV
jgi:hypothetical protein